MSIIDLITFVNGVRMEDAVPMAVEMCLRDRELIAEIADGLGSPDGGLASDCAEVLARIALLRPDKAAPYVEKLRGILHHKRARARWEALHALAFIAPEAPQEILSMVPELEEIIHADACVRAREFAIDTLVNLASTSQAAARSLVPIFKCAYLSWNEMHLERIWQGVLNARMWKAITYRDYYTFSHLRSERLEVTPYAVRGRYGPPPSTQYYLWLHRNSRRVDAQGVPPEWGCQERSTL